LSNIEKTGRLHTVSETENLPKEGNEETVQQAMENLSHSMIQQEQRAPLPFAEFLDALIANPSTVIRNVFQVLHDMVKY